MNAIRVDMNLFITNNYGILFKFLTLATALSIDLVEANTREINFNRDIRPILSEQCFQCHGPDAATRKGGLRLDTRDGATQNNNGNSAINLINFAKSELLVRITSTDPDSKMPPAESKKNLSKQQIQLLQQWIADGAEYDQHWAFKQPVRPPLPILSLKHKNWARNNIDYFVAEKQEEAVLTPSPESDRATLIRRVSLDLTGIPPTPKELESFISNKDPQAYEHTVDRLLESPHYGERWGRHWLDLARYADSDGYSHDAARSMWPYRDWVIKALNKDIPFDHFIIQQLAGDMLPNATLSQRIATGFHRNTQINTEGGVDREQFRIDSIYDRIATTGETMFGLTFGCAQCHDHKYDPISQVEYYRLFAFFNNADEPRIEAPTDEILFQREITNAKINKLQSKLSGLKTKNINRKSLENELANLKKSQPKLPTTLVMAKRKQSRVTRRFIQGDFTRPGEEVQPGTPAILHAIPKQKKDRLGFAQWVANQNNPLLARVAINRMWQHLFGKGIVETENDFGSQGSPPTHPKLLDWLSVEFMENGWSQKKILRLLVNSATYKQASLLDKKIDKDPSNKWLARQNRLRLDAELVRDVALNASGLLSPKMGGPGVFPPQPEGCMDLGQHRKTWSPSNGEDRYRRAVYTYRWRNTPHPALKVFDAPDGLSACTRRLRSNTPLQALTMMNDPAFIELAMSLANRLMSEADSISKRIHLGFQLCVNRSPNSEELHLITKLVEQQFKEFSLDVSESKALVDQATMIDQAPRKIHNEAEFSAWTMAARVLLNLDETITRE